MAKRKTLTAPTLPLELWHELYEAATCFQLLAPWRWMDDTHVFGANNEHGVRLATVLGGMGEVFGLVSYRGSAGADFLMRLRSGEFEPEGPDSCFYQDALLVDFVSRKDLRKEDRALIQQLDFQPPALKPKLFPEFQSHKPGYLPWFIDEAEARLLIDDLRNAVSFAELLRSNPGLYELREGDEFPFLTASISEPLSPAQLDWHTILPAPPSADPAVGIHAFNLPSLLALPQAPKTTWELAAFYASMPISEPPRPYFPKMALAVDGATGIILVCQLGAPDQTMAQAAARSLVQSLQTAGYRPAAIRVDSSNLFHALQPLIDAFGAEFQQAKSLPMADEARRSLEAFGRRI